VLYPFVFEYLKTSGLQKTKKIFKKETNYDIKSHVPPSTSIYDLYKMFLLKSETSDNGQNGGEEVTSQGTKKMKKKKSKKIVYEEPAVQEIEKVVEEEQVPKKKKSKKKNKAQEAVEEAGGESNTEQDNNTEQVETTEQENNEKVGGGKMKKKSRKRKREENGEQNNPEEIKNGHAEEGDGNNLENGNGNGNGEEDVDANPKKKKRKINEPFRKIKVEDNPNPVLSDYKKIVGDEWARRANQDLKDVKGDRFRHEKTKKKRGSYKGGGNSISMGVHSKKYDNSSEDEE